MKVQVTNLSTQEKDIFVNDLSLEENIVSHIICSKKRTGDILNQSFRQQIKTDFPIKTAVSTITKLPFAYCVSLDLHAKFI
jgi:hypothetical protein